MNILTVIRVLNQLKSRHKLKDYAIFGAIGAAFYMEAINTLDLDVIVFASSDEEYGLIWQELSNYSTSFIDFGFIIEGTKVQVLPTNISPLHESAVKHAKAITVGGVKAKVVDKEHLIVLALIAWRPKNQIRAATLLKTANRLYLRRLIKEFDDGTFSQKLKSVS